MDYYKLLFLIALIVCYACEQENEPLNNEELSEIYNSEKSAVGNAAGIIDDFNDGEFSDFWDVTYTDGAFIYEKNGLINIDIEEGPDPNVGCRVAGLTTKEFIFPGDFDVQIDYFLCPDYHTVEGPNTKFIVIDSDDDLIEISIRRGHFLTLELPWGGPATIYNRAYSNALNGKLRIVRIMNTFKTYYFEDEWIKLGEWQAKHVFGELRLDIDSWNWEPDFSAFGTKFDNVIINKGFIKICHKPGTEDQKSLIIPAQALNAHLDHGDFIGSCE